jgi:Uma2 family endonuclease
LSALFDVYFKDKKCSPYPAGMQISLKDGKYFHADLSVVCDDARVEDCIHGAPDLVVEVLSPSTSKKDRRVKLPLYFENGAKEVWLVSVKERAVYVYSSPQEWEEYHVLSPWEVKGLLEDGTPELVRDWVESKLFPEFKPLLADIFARVR